MQLFSRTGLAHNTKALIVNLGLRYEYQTPIDEANNLLANWTPTDGFLQLGVNTKRMWNADKNNFAPRLGFAWDIGGNGKTVVRGGGTGYHLRYANMVGVSLSCRTRTILLRD